MKQKIKKNPLIYSSSFYAYHIQNLKKNMKTEKGKVDFRKDERENISGLPWQ